MPVKNQLFIDLNAATMDQNGAPYGLIEGAAIAVINGKTEWIGKQDTIPNTYKALEKTSLSNRLVTPGLIDCHTHIIHGGNRAAEFEQRLNGASYEEVARAGGGIISTVKATRNASVEELVALALPRVNAMLSEGITTIEVKSGYGLDTETELRMLRVARALPTHRPVRVLTSFLGAHAVPT